MALTSRPAWLFSRRADLAVFGGTTALTLVLLALAVPLGLLHGEAPKWSWVATVLLVDHSRGEPEIQGVISSCCLAPASPNPAG